MSFALCCVKAQFTYSCLFFQELWKESLPLAIVGNKKDLLADGVPCGVPLDLVEKVFPPAAVRQVNVQVPFRVCGAFSMQSCFSDPANMASTLCSLV